MSLALNTKIPDVKWNRDTLLDTGVTFLDAMNDTFKTLKTQWDSAQKSGYYSHDSKMASSRVEIFTYTATTRMIRLEKVAKQALQKETGLEAEQLNAIIDACKAGRGFFEAYRGNAHFATDTNHNFHDIGQLGKGLLDLAVMTYVPALPLLAGNMIGLNTFHSMFHVSFLALGTSVASKVQTVVKARFFDAPQEKKVAGLQQAFDESIALAKLTDQ